LGSRLCGQDLTEHPGERERGAVGAVSAARACRGSLREFRPHRPHQRPTAAPRIPRSETGPKQDRNDGQTSHQQRPVTTRSPPQRRGPSPLRCSPNQGCRCRTVPPMGDRTGSREMNGNSLSRGNHRPGKVPRRGPRIAATIPTEPSTGKGVGVNETPERQRNPVRTPAGPRRIEVS
jgi:hypothetical protein